jgi:triosephosphate isomerase
MHEAPRKPIVAGNWKMHKRIGEAIDLAAEVKRGVAEISGVDVVLCPPFTALKPVGDLLRYSNVRLGAQNAHWESSGAFTGEVSMTMLADLGCAYVIVGHSERRALFGETDEVVRRKAAAALAAGLSPIVCLGETLEQREAGATEAVLAEQMAGSLAGLEAEMARVVLAYEPVWAIGTGRTATAEQAQAAQAFIRERLREAAGPGVARLVRIQYGGSVKPQNAAEIFGRPDVDGGLIGGASLEAASFVEIARAATASAG